MTADPADLAARMIEAAARAVMTTLEGDGTSYVLKEDRDCARAALAAAVREAGLDAVAAAAGAIALEQRAADRRVMHDDGVQISLDNTERMERTAAMLRALGGIADA